jgi:hypothetical protein
VSTLTELQQWMGGALRRRRAVTRDPELTAQAKQQLTGNEAVAPEEQLEIYREQFWLRHTGCLVEDFEALGTIVGQRQWERLVEEYLAEHPPDSPSLRDLGRRLPEFVAQRADWLEHHALAADMAHLEWAYVEIFDAADASPLAAEDLAKVPDEAWPRAVLTPIPALRLLRADHPVAALRRRIRLGEGYEGPPAREPQCLAVYRGQDRNLYHATLEPTAYRVLSALASKTALLSAVERAVADEPEHAESIEASVGSWFQDWSRRGLFCDVRIP